MASSNPLIARMQEAGSEMLSTRSIVTVGTTVVAGLLFSHLVALTALGAGAVYLGNLVAPSRPAATAAAAAPVEPAA